MATTAQVYYTTDELHGNYQFITLSNIIDEMLIKANLATYSYIKNKPMPLILLSAKNGINELTYDMANDVLGLELEIGTDLKFVFPQDYVDWVRVSKLNKNGDLLPLNENRTNNKASTYLQAHDYSILFSEDGDVLEADGNNAHNKSFERKIIHPSSKGAHFQLDTSKFSKNGEFIVDKQRGCFLFDSTLMGESVVVEYISDGLQLDNLKSEDVKVHKYFVEALRRWIEWDLVNNDVNAPERQKNRLERLYRGAKQKAYSRFANIKLTEISKAFRSSNKWIKT